jgi:uncharacterized membrane protein
MEVNMRKHISNRMGIAILIYMMAQGVVYGIGVVLVLATPLSDIALTLLPFVVALSLVAAAPIAWWLAPYARAEYSRRLNAREPGRSVEEPQPHQIAPSSWI